MIEIKGITNCADKSITCYVEMLQIAFEVGLMKINPCWALVKLFSCELGSNNFLYGPTNMS